MVQVIGLKYCARCNAVKNVLKNKGVKFEYHLEEDLKDDTIMKKAEDAGVQSFPMIIKDGEFTNIQAFQ